MKLGASAFALLAALSVSSGALAKTIVVMPFSGPRGGAAMGSVMRMARGSGRLVGARAFQSAAKRSGSSAWSRSGRKAAARALGVAAIVSGSIRRLRGRWVLSVRVHSGHTGGLVGRAVVPLRGTRIDPSARSRLRPRLRSLIRRARAPSGSRRVYRRTRRQRRRARRRRAARRRRQRRKRRIAVRSVPVPKPAPQPQPQPRPAKRSFDDGDDLNGRSDGKRGFGDDPKPTVAPARRVATAREPQSDGDNFGFSIGGDDSARKKRRRRRRRTAQRIRKRSDDDDDDSGDDSDDRRRRNNRRPSWESLIEVSAGLMLVNRKFAFNDPVEPLQPANYETPGVVPAINIEGSAYPFAAFTRSALANIGVTARYFRVLGLESKLDGSAGGATVGTVVQEFEVGLRYRWNILGKASSPVLRSGIDYGRLMFFILDDQNRIPLPNISYTYIKLAIAALDVPFVRSRGFAFGATISFDYLLVLSAGDIERTDSGGYGASTTMGIDIGGGIFASYKGFFAKATGFYRRMFYAFDGVCYRQRTGCNYAGGALDIYAGAVMNLGYAY